MTVPTCDRCGTALPEDARFCPNCGAPVAALVTAERKVVTVLFADLARSTQLATTLDPERFREVMAAFFRMVSTELSALRGRAEKFIGDAAMAVFGLPLAHEDDALRAVRAGMVIRDRTARLAEDLGLPVELAVRVGINSGSVAIGSGPADQLLVSGSAVNMAARLQQAAEPGEVLVGATTWELTRHVVRFGEARAVMARGFDEALAARPVAGLSMRSSRRTIPLVARRREMALLTETYQRVRETGRAHLFTLLGETGIGKSRLADEFVASLPAEAHQLRGRASAFEEDAAFAPLGHMIRRELGVAGDVSAAMLRTRLEEAVAACGDAAAIEQTVGRLGLALGLGTAAGGDGHSYRAAEIRAGLLTWLEAMGRKGTVMLLLDDLHLARPELLDLIEQAVLAARRIPVLVLCVARDGLVERRPTWGMAAPDSFRLRLDPLSQDESGELARLAGDTLDEPTAARVAERAGGNPFFVVETTGMLLERNREHGDGAPHDHLIPPTVQAVVAARIDHLPEEARALFRTASVFARSTFHLSELGLIASPSDELLGVLEDNELLVRDRDRADVWRIRHTMLRDVAYESLPKRERLRLHLMVAEGLAGDDGGDRHPHARAYHLEQAAKASFDLDPTDRTFAERAIRALADAGDRSRRAMESATAVDFYQRALALAAAEEEWGEPEARILVGIGEARYWLGEFDAAGSALTRALEVGAGDDWSETVATRFLADITLNIRSDPERAEELFDRAVEAAHRLGNPFATARTLLMAGWAPYWRDDLEEARAIFEEALVIARGNPEGDRWAEARALTSLASVVSPVGNESECLALAEQALEIGYEIEDRFTVAVAQTYMANSLRRMFRLDEAFPLLDAAVRAFRDLGARWELANALGDRGTVHRLSGRLGDAEVDLRESLKLGSELGDRSVLSWTVSELARILLQTGDVSAARRVLEEAPAGTDPGADPIQTVRVLIELASGDRERAQVRATQLLEAAEAEGPRDDAVVRTWVAHLFGEDAAGGPMAVERAHRTLEGAGWIQHLREPDLMPVAPMVGG